MYSMPRELSMSFYILLLCALIMANINIYRTLFAPRVLEVAILEVGEKSNVILVRAPNGITLLVDTGPDASILRALGAALPEWQRRIDAVVLTSEKSDAIKGLSDVTSRYRVETIMHFGTADLPYGTSLMLDSVQITVLYIGTLDISYGATSLGISSTTPKSTYISDGETVTKSK